MEKGPLIGTGRTADVFTWRQDCILKLYQAWMPASAIEREFTITRLACSTGLPVPATEELIEFDGRLGIVFERIRGIPMLKVLENQPWRLSPLSCLLAELHARMHTCLLPADMISQRQRIVEGIGWAKDLPDPQKRSILAILDGLPEADAFCHGDFHPDNVLLTERGPFIIDWMNGGRGHPLEDVARTSLLLQAGGLPPGMSPFMRLVINALRRLFYSVYLKRYLQIHPASSSEIDSWQLPLLAARLFEVENYPQEKTLILQRIQAALAKIEQ